MKNYININGVKYVNYTESDLRFTGWEDECIIIDRTENHYLIPLKRYKELKTKPKIKPTLIPHQTQKMVHITPAETSE